MTALRLLIRGRVQGVGYRAWMVRRATALGVSGWVRNCADGAVEAMVEGDDASLGALLRECQSGPRLAEVTGIASMAAEPEGAAGFRQLPAP